MAETTWQNCRVKRARTNTQRHPVLPVLGALAVLLAASAGCSAVDGGNGGASARLPSTQASSTQAPSTQSPLAPAPPVPARIPSTAATLGPATSASRDRVEAALTKLSSGGSKPGTEQIRAALVEAGFPRASIEVTASQTPTGLQADAVEAAVRQDRNCVVAQLRNGAVAVTVLTVLADGRCFAGSAA